MPALKLQVSLMLLWSCPVPLRHFFSLPSPYPLPSLACRERHRDGRGISLKDTKGIKCSNQKDSAGIYEVMYYKMLLPYLFLYFFLLFPSALPCPKGRQGGLPSVISFT